MTSLMGLREAMNRLPPGETRNKLVEILEKVKRGHAGGPEAMREIMMNLPGGCSRGQIAATDPILTKARKYVELCDGPIYPDFEDPPGAMLCGEEALWSSRRYGQALEHCYSHHLEQLAAIHGLYYLSMADSEDCRLDLIDSHHLGIRGIDGECRRGLVAVQGALASAHDRNWTNLALFFTRTPPFGDDVDRFPPDVQKFAEQNGWAGLTPDQHHPKYIAMMKYGPLGLLNSICVFGGPHPCLDRLLDHPRCADVLERLLSFISRCPEVMNGTRAELEKLEERNPCVVLALMSFSILRGICAHTKGGEEAVVEAVEDSQRLDSVTKTSFEKKSEQKDGNLWAERAAYAAGKLRGKRTRAAGVARWRGAARNASKGTGSGTNRIARAAQVNENVIQW
eukprot:CAMPEP_0198198732 /NCGR_PEP_ID=MMETSP1445-20131203/2143_1 /TAXON_ID=36898 /ORGANISM="Pyramimonas sp., Strain CCMP2087" /LENGTH=395 /DNA_ID=CAMNT_0043868365 /DNA_START=168 /DNA_END=1353 /DNA_ORIENTATION=+